jgi:GT2 family glycosyltransferase
MGDQAIFVRRDALEKIGGVPDVPLMEEFELCRLLRQRGRLALAPTVVSTSARRFHENGALRTYARMWWVTLLYYFGISPDELKRIYDKR